MTDRETSDSTVYKVVVNHEEQYSIWPADRENPLGWRDAGKTGTKDECLEHIREVWTDMRPLSVRRKTAETEPIGIRRPEEESRAKAARPRRDQDDSRPAGTSDTPQCGSSTSLFSTSRSSVSISSTTSGSNASTL